jgi:Domain of unknown function (DUF4349)
MKRVDDTPIDPEVAAALDAIDATLAGDPVDPAHAELAELALLLTAARPQPDPAFAASLDEQVVWRFAADGPSAPRRRRTWWVLSPAWGGGLVAAATAGVVAVVLVTSGGGGHPTLDAKPGIPLRAAVTNTSASSSSGASSGSGSSSAASVPAHRSGQPSRLLPSPSTKYSPAFTGSVSGTASSATAPTPPSSGRKIIQSAQLSLTTPPSRIDAVAQEVFNVVGNQNGFVQRSNVTAGGAANSSAQFQLSVPSSNLSQTMAQLSQLKYADVSSRTDATQDVNDQYVGDARRLADAKASRTALLKQLAAAVTATQIDSLNQQIHDADQEISSDQGTVNNLNHQVDYSQIQVTINGALIAPTHHKSGGFTLGKAAHDAGRVLTVAAGVALITLAALVPVALLATLGWWVITAIRRRRREQALDLA